MRSMDAASNGNFLKREPNSKGLSEGVMDQFLSNHIPGTYFDSRNERVLILGRLKIVEGNFSKRKRHSESQLKWSTLHILKSLQETKTSETTLDNLCFKLPPKQKANENFVLGTKSFRNQKQTTRVDFQENYLQHQLLTDTFPKTMRNVLKDVDTKQITDSKSRTLLLSKNCNQNVRANQKWNL